MQKIHAMRCFGGKEGLVAVLVACRGQRRKGEIPRTTLKRWQAAERRAVDGWREFPPLVRQYQLEVLTGGVLRAQRAGRRGEDYRE